MRMLVENSDDHRAADPSLLRIIARAHDAQDRLIQNCGLTVQDIAREERVSAAYIYTLLRLHWLAPDITTAIVNGQQPPQLNAMTLMRRRRDCRLTGPSSERCLASTKTMRRFWELFGAALRDASRRAVAPKSKPRNSPREIFTDAANEIARTGVSVANRMASDSRKCAPIRDRTDARRRLKALLSQHLNAGWGARI